MKEKLLARIAKFLIVLTFIAPLIVIPSEFIFPFIVPKVLFFRSVVLLMLGSYILLLVSNWERYKPRLSALNITVLLFFVALVVSSIVGIDFHRSFWDNHERMLGVFTLFHYVLFYFIVSAVAREWGEWKMLLRSLLVAGGLVMLIGFWQKFIDTDALLNRGGERVSATLGNAIYYSGYGLFLLTLGAYMAVREKMRTLWWYVSVAIAVLGFLGIFLGGTRGAFLGLLAAIAAGVVTYAVLLKGQKRVRQSLGAVIVLGVLLLGSFFAFRSTTFVQELPVVGRFANASFTSGTIETRLMAWDIALDAAQEKPIFGWGPNNFYYAFNQYYNPAFLEHGYGETWFDNAHSSVMNTLATGGIVGLLVYLALFGVTGFVAYRAYCREDIDLHSFAFIIVFLVGHFVATFFVFENPTSYLYFFLVLAFVQSQMQRESDDGVRSTAVSLPAAGVTAVVVLLLINATNINPGQANSRALESLQLLQAGRVEMALERYEQATQIPTPHIDDVHNDFARTVTQVIPQYAQEGQENQQHIPSLFETAMTALDKNIALHPADVRARIQKAILAQYGAQLFNDTSYYQTAEETLETALEYSPQRQQLQYMLSQIKLILGENDEAIALLEDARDGAPAVSESWWRLALAYEQAGEHEQAVDVFEQAGEQGVTFGQQGAQVKEQIVDATAMEQ